MKKKLTFIILFIVIGFQSLAQNEPMKFEKIEMTDMQMEVYDKDTAAAAIILCDYGYSYFTYTELDGFQINFEHHCRIKILNQIGYDWANVSIPFYISGATKEKVIGIKANTYNLENGKITKDKLSNKDQFTEEINKNKSVVKFTMPNVKEGSIIEYKYNIKSDFLFNFRNWQFQYSIPVLWSEYRAEIPEYFHYNKTQKGYEAISVNEQERRNKIFTYTHAAKTVSASGSRAGGNFSRESSGTSEFEVLTDISRWVAKDIPAFKEEAYLTNADNYLTIIDFELASIQYPNSIRKDYTSTWEAINKQLLENESFGLQYLDNGLLTVGGFIKDEVGKITTEFSDPKARMIAAFEFVKKYMKWDGYNSVYVSSNLRKAYKERSGNSADINLLLTLMLKELGLEVIPIVLSTRANGIIHPAHPVLSKFNYVVAKVEINGESYLLDATDPLNQVNMLPFRCLNDKGRIVDITKSDWIDLYTKKSDITTTMYDLNISEDGVFIGKYQSSKANYAAFSYRKAMEASLSQEKFIEELEKNNNGLKINSFKFENLENVDEPVKEEFELTISDQAEVMGDMIYFTPLLHDKMEKNPFKLEERKYPVDYGSELKETNIYKYTIPEGYQVEEMPKPINIALADNAARFTYSISLIGNSVQVMSQFSINKTLFLPNEYQNLKNFYDQVISKHAEQIILKKQAE